MRLPAFLFPIITFFALTLGALASAVYTGIPVTCQESSNGATTESLTITFDDSGAGTVTGGDFASSNCAFQLSGQAVSPPFSDGTLTYLGSGNTVCWQIGVCNGSSTQDTLTTTTTANGTNFVIDSGSIVTTFTITPEPGSVGLAGLGLLAVVLRLKCMKTSSAGTPE